MATVGLALKVSLAWWIKPYFYCLATMSALTGMEPSYERVSYWIGKAIKIKAA